KGLSLLSFHQSYLLTQAKPGPWKFHSEVLTDQSPREICRNIIREKLLEYLPEEVPYNVHQRTEVWEEGPGGELVILQNLEVQKERHVVSTWWVGPTSPDSSFQSPFSTKDVFIIPGQVQTCGEYCYYSRISLIQHSLIQHSGLSNTFL
uniref:Uncharacterized protein n=1 Tax=Anolis carolinensis TaxID=28377 RepID=H9GG22_ANOCA